MKSYDLLTPVGTNDLLFEDCIVRREAEERLRIVFEKRGYCEIITPELEFFDVFNRKSRYFPQESLYKSTDNKGRILVVRPDSTMPIARIAATRLRDEKLPLRLYYCQKVYRNNPVMRGRNDEIKQMGIELIGSDSKRADFEIISTAIEVLASFDKKNFCFEIGDIGIFRELVLNLHVDDETMENIRSLIEVKNYPALNELLDSIGDNDTVKALKHLPRLYGGLEVFAKAQELIKDEKIIAILDNLKNVYTKLQELGYNGKITVDLGMANKINYYTGIVMKGYLDGYGDTVLSGGRYNNLLSDFGFNQAGAGFAVNIDAVSKILKQNEEVLVPVPEKIYFGEDGFEMKALIESQTLCNNGVICENSVFDTLKETAEYADSKGIKTIVVVSDTIKEMKSIEFTNSKEVL